MNAVPVAAGRLHHKTFHALARNVRVLRAAAGLTLAQAGERSGLHWRHWQKVEAGHTNAGIETLCRVAAGLGVELHDLLRPPRVS